MKLFLESLYGKPTEPIAHECQFCVGYRKAGEREEADYYSQRYGGTEWLCQKCWDVSEKINGKDALDKVWIRIERGGKQT